MPVVITIALVIAVTLWLLSGWVIARHFLNRDHHQFPLTESPIDRGIKAQRLRIQAHHADEQPGHWHEVAAWMLTPDPARSLGGACVVMVHGFGSGKDKVWTCDQDPTYRASMLDQGAQSLWEAGFHVVAIDLRNHGESADCGPVTLGAHEAEDVLATVDYLVDHAAELGIDPDRIGLRGESMGGATCLLAAANDSQHRIAAVWADSAYACAAQAIADRLSYEGVPRLFVFPTRLWLSLLTGVSLREASPIYFIDRIRCPVLLTHSTGDTMLPVRHCDNFRQSDRWQAEPEVWQLESHQHNRLWQEPEYHERQIEFFSRRLAS